MTVKSVLSSEAITEALCSLSDWSVSEGVLVKTYKHAEFLEGISFVQKIATLAEELNHHPDIDIRYRRVRLALVTHSAGGITRQDIEFALAADALWSEPRD